MTTSISHEKKNDTGPRQSFAIPALAWTLVLLGLLLWWEVEIQPLSEWVLAAVYLMGLAAVVLSIRVSRSAAREWALEDRGMSHACDPAEEQRAGKIGILQQESDKMIRVCAEGEAVRGRSWGRDSSGPRMQQVYLDGDSA